MNKTQPPKGTPLYNALYGDRPKPLVTCPKCVHRWEIDGLWYCGKSGKLLLYKSIPCNKFKEEPEEEPEEEIEGEIICTDCLENE